MGPAAIGAILAALGPVVGGGMGYITAAPDDIKADWTERLAAHEYDSVSAPTLERVGTSFANMPSDYGNTGARNAAIQALMREGLSGGNTLETQLAQAQAQRAAGQATRQSQQTALANAAQRGTGGGAATLQAQMLGGSQGADRAAQLGLEGATNARRQALMALQQGGGMAGTAEAADASRDARRRESLDAMARFNEAQRQQHFQNQLNIANRKAESRMMLADVDRARAERKRRIWGTTGNAVGQGGAALSTFGGGK